MTTPVVPEAPVAAPVAPVPTPTPPAATPTPATPAALHDDPAIAKALEGLTEEQREQLLTQGGKSALTKAKEAKVAAVAAAQTASDAARAELAQQIGKALGLVEDESADPAKLTEALTASQSDAKQAKTELAVFHASAGVADASALLDSRSFMASVAELDPNDPTALSAAITAAVTANPSLALVAANAPRIPAPNPALGSSAAGAPDAAALIEAARAKGDWKTVVALENQKLVRPT